jgi:hypothetical protein
MDIGLLWYDSDPKRTLEDKIGQAARRYQEKYGRWPDTCYVHPQAVVALPEQKERAACRLENGQATIRVLSAPNVLLHHLWLGEGTDDSPLERKRAAN